MTSTARLLITTGALVGALVAPGGASAAGWAAQVPQPHPSVETVDGLVLRASGEAWMASMVETGPGDGELRVSERQPGGGFAAPEVAGSASGYSELGLVDVPGAAPLLAWFDEDGGHVSARGDDGSWAPVPGPFGPKYHVPEIVALADGSVLVFWCEGTELLARTRLADGDFGPPQVVADGLPNVGDFELDATATTDGGAAVAWAQLDPAPDAPARRALRVVSRSPGGEWGEPVVLDTVTVTPHGEDDYANAGFYPVQIAARLDGGWVIATRRYTSHDIENSPGGPAGTDAIRVWDGHGGDVQAARTLDEGTYGTPGGTSLGRRLEALIVDASGGTFVWWDRANEARLSTYRPSGGDFPAPASTSDGRETNLAPLGGDRWYRLDWAYSEPSRAGALRGRCATLPSRCWRSRSRSSSMRVFCGSRVMGRVTRCSRRAGLPSASRGCGCTTRRRRR